MTSSPDAWWRADGDGIVVRVRATPGARRTEIVDATGDRVRVRVAAPAVEGKANAALVRFLADRFGVRPSAVALVGGEHARDKLVRISGVTAPPPALG